MSVRIQVVVQAQERDHLHRLAAERGESLSAWVREAARQRAEREGVVGRFRSGADVDAFFARQPAAELMGREPDWTEHLRVIDESRRQGATST